MGRGDLAGSAHLELVSGVAQLRPEDAMFEAMLRGWRAQQVARGLRADTIEAREHLVRRFLEATNEYPWNWGPGTSKSGPCRLSRSATWRRRRSAVTR